MFNKKKLFNSRNDELWELLNVDDLRMLAEPEEELQRRVVEWQDAVERKRIKVNEE